jgi:hypothetical protein
MFIPRLSDFEGEWALDRQIEDRLLDAPVRFQGRAIFRPDGEGYRYQEVGQMTIGDAAPMEARRAYLWFQRDGRIVVTHDDGRPFHDFDPADPVARHVCTPDDYRVRYDFSGWPDWSATWRVSGPRKNYRLVSRYSRLR